MTEDNSIIAMCQYGNSLWDNHIIDYILSFRDLKHSIVPGWPEWKRRASALARRWQGLCLWTFLIIGCILHACSFFRLASSHQELTLKKKESKMVGEQLMRLLETLDGISFRQNMLELRARRKKAADRINSLMDANDSKIQVRKSKPRTFCWFFWHQLPTFRPLKKDYGRKAHSKLVNRRPAQFWWPPSNGRKAHNKPVNRRPADCESFARRTFTTPKIRTSTTPKFGHFPPLEKKHLPGGQLPPPFFLFFWRTFLGFFDLQLMEDIKDGKEEVLDEVVI